MSVSGSLRIERPYLSPEAYLEGDAWTVERAEMLLLGAASLPPGTLVRFEVVLANGDLVVCGEGRAVEAVEAREGREGGLRVRFRQLDPDSKAMLKRALEARRRAGSPSGLLAAVPVAPSVPPVPSVLSVPSVPPEQSGVRHRAVTVIVAPENRDTLLARLRARNTNSAVELPKRRAAAE